MKCPFYIQYESLDIETIWDNNIAKPFCIAITCNEKVHYKKISSMGNIDSFEIIQFMLEKCSSKKIYYVHNLTFEILVFLRYLVKENIKFKIISANKTVYSAEIWYNKKKIRLRCSYKLTMLSLKDLAKLAEVEEKGIFPYEILTKTLKENMDICEKNFSNIEEFEKFKKIYGTNINTHNILKEYCINDAIITKKSITKFWKIIEESGLKNNNKILTAAKLSIVNYFSKNNLIKKKIAIKYDRLLRPGYFGGRTEVFGNPRDTEILLHYDWSGMYAQCMSEKILGGEPIETDIIKSLEEPGFYWIKYKQDLEFPVLPIKTTKLLFANGEFEGWYWFEEILLAISMGVKIINIKKMISAQYYGEFIKDFVEINTKIRYLGPLHKQIGKNNNNTFYGRLGMNPNRLEEEILSNIDNPKKYEKIVEINGAYIGYKKKEKNISNILVSASITSKARIKLYKGIKDVQSIGGRIMYTDTDSIIAAFDKKEYIKNLNKQIGEVIFDSTKKDTIIIDAVFALPKTYALQYKDIPAIVKIKGFNVKPEYDEFKKTFYEKGIITTKNIEWNKKDLIIKIIEREKKTSLNGLDKRIWNNDLKSTEPITL